MASSTNNPIGWCDVTWNPVRGCSRVSPGCDNCYAMGQAHRFSGPGKPFEGLTTIRKGKVDWSGAVRLVPDALDVPLRTRKPTKFFVNSMSDLFHRGLKHDEVAAVFGVMAACPQHTFQILTKRPDRMRDWMEDASARVCGELEYCGTWAGMKMRVPNPLEWFRAHAGASWPLPNVWLGTSCEDQERADERIPHLLETPAAVRFVSAEPLLGPLNLHAHLCVNGSVERPAQKFGSVCATRGDLHWVIVGGESGPGARPCNVDWIFDVVESCRLASVPCFVKQLGANVMDRNDVGFDGDEGDRWPEATMVDPYWLTHPTYRHQGGPCRVLLDDRKGGAIDRWPLALRIRQFPGEARP